MHKFFHDLISYPQFMYAFFCLNRLKKPIVTIFGGKNTKKESEFYKEVYDLAAQLVQHNISVITGGGPGIMEAALCGAAKERAKNMSLGIGVQEIDKDFKPSCRFNLVSVNNFAARKWLLINCSKGFVCFPGGIGTLDEILEVLNLIKTKKLKPVPIVLIGKDYWKHFVAWFEYAIAQGYIVNECAHLFSVTDDIQEALAIMLKTQKHQSNNVRINF